MFDLENFKGWNFHLTSDESKIFPHSHNATDGPLYPLMKSGSISNVPL